MKNLPEPYASFFAQTQAVTPLDGDDRFPAAWHDWSDVERKAVVHAWATERPLLVRGEPGCGKSQLARAVANVLGVPLEMEVIHPRFEATDLKYREDPVRRLAHAQVLGALQAHQKVADAAAWVKEELSPSEFTDKGAVWRAIVSPTPVDARATARHSAWPRAVLLIDEIDKADADVPNALLDVLGNRSFATPGGEVVRCEEGHFPLVIVTTNEERELPPAFLRRCAVLNLQPPADENGFTDWLLAKAKAHQHLAALMSDKHTVASRAAAQTWADRNTAVKDGLPTVGLAEYLDLMYSLMRLSGNSPAKADELLDEVSVFALVKHRDQKQDRAPVASRPAA